VARIMGNKIALLVLMPGGADWLYRLALGVGTDMLKEFLSKASA